MRTKTKKPTKRSVEEVVESEHSEYIQDESSRTILFVGDVSEELVKSTAERLIQLAEKDSKKPIHLIINTHGGFVYDAFMLYDLIKFLPVPVYTIGLGKIMSAGCLLLAAGKKRKMGRNATIMYHASWSSSAGTVWQMKSELEENERLEQRFNELFALETGMSIEDVNKLYNSKGPTVDTYITAEVALKKGIIDELI